MRKRILALFLSITMFVSLLTVPAWAYNDEIESTEGIDTTFSLFALDMNNFSDGYKNSVYYSRLVAAKTIWEVIKPIIS